MTKKDYDDSIQTYINKIGLNAIENNYKIDANLYEAILKREKELDSKTTPEEFNDLEKLSYQYSKMMFDYARKQKGRDLTYEEMNKVAKQIIEEQDKIIRKYSDDGKANKEINLSEEVVNKPINNNVFIIKDIYEERVYEERVIKKDKILYLDAFQNSDTKKWFYSIILINGKEINITKEDYDRLKVEL